MGFWFSFSFLKVLFFIGCILAALFSYIKYLPAYRTHLQVPLPQSPFRTQILENQFIISSVRDLEDN